MTSLSIKLQLLSDPSAFQQIPTTMVKGELSGLSRAVRTHLPPGDTEITQINKLTS